MQNGMNNEHGQLRRGYIYADDKLHRFNGTYWEAINSEYVYNLLEVVYRKLKSTIEDKDIVPQIGDAAAIEKLKKDLLRKICVLKKQSYSKSLFEYIKSKYHKLESPFNNNIFLIGFTNGVYDLEEASFRTARKEDYISFVCPCEYSASDDEDIAFVQSYMAKIMPVEDERELLLLLLSTCLSGYVLDNFVCCTGLGSNAKDTLFNYMLREVLGPYFYRASNTVLTQRAMSDLNVGIANMDKKRAIIFSETSDASTINCALIKELTGGNEVNARGLYSSNTKVNLHGTMFILCNDKPMLDKVDEAIVRRLITFRFRSTFKSQVFLDECSLSDGENYVYLGDNEVKSTTFLQRYRLPFMNMLLPYFQKFKEAGYTINKVPESSKAQSRMYMEQSDPLYNWFSSTYRKTNEKSDVIKLKDVFNELRMSEYYLNLTKMDKRKLTYASLVEYVEKSPLLRMFYKERERTQLQNSTQRNILTNFRRREQTDEED